MKLSCFRSAGTMALVLICATCSLVASTPCDQNADTWEKRCTQNDNPPNVQFCMSPTCTITVTASGAVAYVTLANNNPADIVCIKSAVQKVTWIDSKGGLATFDVNFGQSAPFVGKTEFSGDLFSHQDSDSVSGEAVGCYPFSVEHCSAAFIGCRENDPRVIVQGGQNPAF